MTQDGEVATYASQVVGNITGDGRVLSVGVNFWSTQSTGKLSFMNDDEHFQVPSRFVSEYFSYGMGMEIAVVI